MPAYPHVPYVGAGPGLHISLLAIEISFAGRLIVPSLRDISATEKLPLVLRQQPTARLLTSFAVPLVGGGSCEYRRLFQPPLRRRHLFERLVKFTPVACFRFFS